MSTDTDLIAAAMPKVYAAWSESADLGKTMLVFLQELRRIKEEQDKALRQRQDADAQRSIR